MKKWLVAFALVCIAAMAGAETREERKEALQQEAERAAVLARDASYGDRIQLRYGIADMRIGSQDADRRGTSTYTAPAGFVILGHEIFRRGHHSGVSHAETAQPGRLSYESRAAADLHDAIREGLVEGSLFIPGDGPGEVGSGMTALKYADFRKRFDAEYQFVSNTIGSIEFKWFLDSKRYAHGALLIAHAEVTIQRMATEADAQRAAELIRFALEMSERNSVFELMDSALGIRRPGQ